jgi:hypothetical protein
LYRDGGSGATGGIELHAVAAGGRCEPALASGGCDTGAAGTVTAVVPASGERPALALLSGHASAPRGRSGIDLDYDAEREPAAPVRFTAPTPGLGRLRVARVGEWVDAALAVVADAADPVHPGANAAPPFHTTAFAAVGTRVSHVSRMRAGQRVTGYVRAGSGPGAFSGFKVTINGGSHVYRDAWVVESDSHEQFSVGGDSGSLVFIHPRSEPVGAALAMVVAGDAPGRGKACSYILPVRALIGTVLSASDPERSWQRFFQESR